MLSDSFNTISVEVQKQGSFDGARVTFGHRPKSIVT